MSLLQPPRKRSTESVDLQTGPGEATHITHERVARDFSPDWPSALEFVNSAAGRLLAQEHRSRSQDETINELSAQLVLERARSDQSLAYLQAEVQRLCREQMWTLERLEESLIECSLLRLAFRQVAEDARVAEQKIRQSTDQICDLKRKLVPE